MPQPVQRHVDAGGDGDDAIAATAAPKGDIRTADADVGQATCDDQHLGVCRRTIKIRSPLAALFMAPMMVRQACPRRAWQLLASRRPRGPAYRSPSAPKRATVMA